MESLYHITDSENKEKIKMEGLKPMIGKNSALVGETSKAIYLSSRKTLPYWQVILGKPVIIKIDKSFFHKSIPVKSRNFGKVDEYCVETEIPTSYLSFPNNNSFEIPQEIYDTVHKNYLIEVSYLCHRSAYAQQYNKELFKYIADDANGILSVLNRLNYGKIGEDKISKILKEYGNDGEYTLADTYMNTKAKLWEMLKVYQYPDIESANIMHRLYKWIKSNIPEKCLKMNTGGWTG